MKRIVRLTESDLTRIVRRTLNEMGEKNAPEMDCFRKHVVAKLPSSCKPQVFTQEEPQNCIADLAEMLTSVVMSGNFREAAGITDLIACLNENASRIEMN